MKKKFQVVVPDWMEDYLNYLVDRYDLNISEVIRLEICFAILAMTEKLFPEHEMGITSEQISELPTLDMDKIERDQLMRMLSKLYFEARKAAEYRMKKES